MEHPIFKITSVEIKSPYTLELSFDDGKKKEINFEKVLNGEIYSPLRDINFFNQVKLDTEVFTIVWPNGADFDPAILHDWEKYEKELIERTKSWETIKV